MKYRFEEGEAKVPLSEINRLNDLFEQLEEKDNNLTRRENELNKALKDETKIVIAENIGSIYGSSYAIVTIDEACERVERIRTIKDKRFESAVDTAVKASVDTAVNTERKETEKQTEDKFFEMNAQEFVNWKKGREDI